MGSEFEFETRQRLAPHLVHRWRGRRWFSAGLILAQALSFGGVAVAAHHSRPKSAATSAPSTSLHARAVAALAAARSSFDGRLNDYPTARFEDVHARLVHSVYADDEGDSNKVPWIHRGGLVVVLCGQVNAKNRMGAYTGWSRFAFEPAQTDMVDTYGFESPTRLLRSHNLAAEDSLSIVDEDGGFSNDEVRLLCGDDPPAQEIDAADLSTGLEARR